MAELDTLGYEVVETQSFTNEVNTALTKLKERDTRIILGNFNEHWARMIFCEAYHLEMYGRRYQWIIMGTYRDRWWQKLETDSNCTVEDLQLALEQTILTDLLPLSTSGEITISGIVSSIKRFMFSANFHNILTTSCSIHNFKGKCNLNSRQQMNTCKNTIREEDENIQGFTDILTMGFGLWHWPFKT